MFGFPFPNPDNDEIIDAKLSAYVDDSHVFNSTENYIKESFNILNKFKNASGAKSHKTKTTAIYIGQGKTEKPVFEETSWTDKYVKTLGVYHGYHILKQNVWIDKIKKIKNCIQI